MKTKEIKHCGQDLTGNRSQTSLSLFFFLCLPFLSLSVSVSTLLIFTHILSLSLAHSASQLPSLSPYSLLLCCSCSVHVTSVPLILRLFFHLCLMHQQRNRDILVHLCNGNLHSNENLWNATMCNNRVDFLVWCWLKEGNQKRINITWSHGCSPEEAN